MMFDIKDKVAIVTGANTGLGQAICVAYAKAGAKVLGVARRSCAETKAKIDAIGGIQSCSYLYQEQLFAQTSA